MGQIKDTVIAITGASSGIGRAAARELAGAGAKVVMGARRADNLAALEKELAPNAVAVPMDVRSREDAKRLVQTAVERFGRLDSIVVNAGIGAYGGIMDLSDDFLETMMDTNLAGTVWAIRAAVPEMLKAGHGDIVILASVAGFRGDGNEAVYASTKFAQIGLAGSLDRELREKNIRIMSIGPASVATGFAIGRGRTEDMPEAADFLQPEDIAFMIRTVLEQPRRLRTQYWTVFPMSEGS